MPKIYFSIMYAIAVGISMFGIINGECRSDNFSPG